jgi:hypothetical protein
LVLIIELVVAYGLYGTTHTAIANENSTDGNYKSRYTPQGRIKAGKRGTYRKDVNVWVYTSAFAKRFGMPQEWIDDDQKLSNHPYFYYFYHKVQWLNLTLAYTAGRKTRKHLAHQIKFPNPFMQRIEAYDKAQYEPNSLFKALRKRLSTTTKPNK